MLGLCVLQKGCRAKSSVNGSVRFWPWRIMVLSTSRGTFVHQAFSQIWGPKSLGLVAPAICDSTRRRWRHNKDVARHVDRGKELNLVRMGFVIDWYWNFQSFLGARAHDKEHWGSECRDSKIRPGMLSCKQEEHKRAEDTLWPANVGGIRFEINWF